MGSNASSGNARISPRQGRHRSPRPAWWFPLIGVALLGTLIVLYSVVSAARSARAASSARAARAAAEDARDAERSARLAFESEAMRRAYASAMRLAELSMRGGDNLAVRAALDAAPESMRGWEWRFLSSRLNTVSAGVDLPHGPVYRVAFARNGAAVYVHSERQVLRVVVDSEDGACVLGSPEVLYAASEGERIIALSPDASMVVVARMTGPSGPRVIDRLSGRVVLTCEEPKFCFPPYIDFSPDGRWLVAWPTGDASTPQEKPNASELHVFDLQSSAAPATTGALDAHTFAGPMITAGGGLLAAAVSPSNTASTEQFGVRTWERASNDPTVFESARHLPAPARVIGPLRANETGSRITSRLEDGSVLAWEVETAKVLWRTKRTDSRATALAISGSGRLAAVAWSDNTVELVSSATGVQQGELLRGCDFSSDDLAFSPDDRLLACAARDRLLVWECERRGRVAIPALYVGSMLSLPSQLGTRGVVADELGTRVFDRASGDIVASVPWALRGRRDGPLHHLIATDAEARTIVRRMGDAAVVVDAGTGQVRTAVPLGGTVSSREWFFILPDGSRLGIGGGGGPLRMIDCATGDQVGMIDPPGHEVRGASACAECPVIAVTTATGVAVFDVGTLEQTSFVAGQPIGAVTVNARAVAFAEPGGVRIARLDGGGAMTKVSRSQAVHSLRFDAPGTRLAVGFDDGSVIICDAATGDELLTLDAVGSPEPVRDLVWGLDSSLITVTNVVRVWPVEATREVSQTLAAIARRQIDATNALEPRALVRTGVVVTPEGNEVTIPARYQNEEEFVERWLPVLLDRSAGKPAWRRVLGEALMVNGARGQSNSRGMHLLLGIGLCRAGSHDWALRELQRAGELTCHASPREGARLTALMHAAAALSLESLGRSQEARARLDLACRAVYPGDDPPVLIEEAREWLDLP